MKSALLAGDLHQLLLKGSLPELQTLAEDAHPADIAEAVSGLEPEERWTALARFEPHFTAEVFSHLEDDVQGDIITRLNRPELAWLMTYIPSDDRVDIFRRLPEERQASLLPALAQAEREDIRRLASYPEGSAGAVMTSEYVTVPAHETVDEAITRLRKEAFNKETIYYAYVVDEHRRLIGFVSLKDLILAAAGERIEDLMHKDVIFVRATDDQEEAARLITKYDLFVLPVINGNDAMVGIITHDDAIDVINQEHTEDMEKLMAIAGSHEAGGYLRTPVMVHFKNRVSWIVSLAVVGLLSGTIVHRYEETLASLMLLALYMPMLADTGGNTGSQAATVIVRALALKDVAVGDVFRVLFKELRIALMLSGVLGCLTFGRVMLLSRGVELPAGLSLPMIGGAIALALSIQVVSATLAGAVLPMIAAFFKKDPALVASPALTTVVDITGLLIYFNTATMLLGI